MVSVCEREREGEERRGERQWERGVRKRNLEEGRQYPSTVRVQLSRVE